MLDTPRGVPEQALTIGVSGSYPIATIWRLPNDAGMAMMGPLRPSQCRDD